MSLGLKVRGVRAAEELRDDAPSAALERSVLSGMWHFNVEPGNSLKQVRPSSFYISRQ